MDQRAPLAGRQLLLEPLFGNLLAEAFRLGERTEDPLAMYLGDYFTVPFSLAGIPGISIPSGLSDGLPVGFQLAGPAFSENRILDAAYALEQAIGFQGLPIE